MVLAGMMVTGVSYGIVLNCFGLFVKPVSEMMGFPRQGFATSLTIVYVFYMLCSITPGKLIEKFGLGRLMRIAALLMAVGLLLLAVGCHTMVKKYNILHSLNKLRLL